ncbi:hypothetical protein SPHINGOAX6_70649 [Sphingomonas sp. AX6]|nr:hypothetical protein SPHINGOAX6_70649 [Sphingomonas sp. AX6]
MRITARAGGVSAGSRAIQVASESCAPRNSGRATATSSTARYSTSVAGGLAHSSVWTLATRMARGTRGRSASSLSRARSSNGARPRATRSTIWRQVDCAATPESTSLAKTVSKLSSNRTKIARFAAKIRAVLASYPALSGFDTCIFWDVALWDNCVSLQLSYVPARGGIRIRSL